MKKNKLFIYQLLPRLFSNSSTANVVNGSIEENGCGKFNDITDNVLKQLKKSGYTHIWYIGVLSHATVTDYSQYGIPKDFPEIVKGNAGSPYAIKDYYDVDPDLAVDVENRIQEFDALVKRTHKAGLKVIIDNVPNHLARNYKSLSKPKGVKDFGENDDNSLAFSTKNNFYYLPCQELELQLPPAKLANITYQEKPAKVTGNDCFTNKPTQYDWYETVKLNYGVDYGNRSTHFYPIPDTWVKMKDVLLFWADRNVDGFRCDMAEMVPLEFWQWAIPQVKARNPEIIFFAEIYNPTVYRNFLAGNIFDYLYDKVGLYDVLRDVACGYRPSSDITFTLNSVGDIQHKMLNFMENHDEQRMASDYFLKSGEKGKAAMIVTSCINTNPTMIYAGQEFGEKGMDEEGFSGRNGRTTIFDYWSVDTLRRWNNDGKWNDELLTEEEINLKNFYSDLMNLCNKEKSISEGLFYDLMPANYENQGFDSTKQFAFLRSDKKDLLLVVVNFDNEDRDVNIYIPDHAFHFLDMQPSLKGKLQPLLVKQEPISYSEDNPLTVKVQANSGEIYKIYSL